MAVPATVPVPQPRVDGNVKLAVHVDDTDYSLSSFLCLMTLTILFVPFPFLALTLHA